MRRNSTPLRLKALAILLLVSLTLVAFPIPFISFISPVEAASSTVVISEFRNRGPNGASDEFVELYNLTNSPINIGGWKINGSNNAGSVSTRVTINAGTTIPAHGHFLATNSTASTGYSGSVPGNQTYTTGITDDGGIALLDSSNNIIDQVGLSAGSAYKEGTVLTSLGTTNANRGYERKPGGANGSTQDTDNNASDFQLLTPSDPQNLASAPTPSGTPTANPGALQFSSATYSVAENGATATITVNRTGGSDGSVSIDYATSNGTADSSDYQSASGTLNFANGETSKTFTVQILDDSTIEDNETVNLALTNPTGGATLGSPSSAVLTITDDDTPPTTGVPGSVVISQVYGGGGNSGATLKNDFIEIFNRSANPVNLAGWSVQYASAGGGATAVWNRRTPLSGTIQPGQYFLIQEAAGAGGTVDLPPPDITGTLALGGTDGKVALVSNNVDLPDGCPIGNPNVIDFVGYGTADCFEGAQAAPQLSSTTAALRARNGCRDTNINQTNFTAVAPNPRNSSTAFNFCPAGDESPAVFSTTPASGASNIAAASDITINFDEPVNVSGNWFQISCATSGLHTATVTGGPTTFTLNPDTDFVGNEQCTVTVFASGVTDQDTNDPPDNMDANYTWSFGTSISRDTSEHLVMGNPSGAVTDVNTPLNYLMTKPQYALSYNNDKGTPNWTSWHLDSTWVTGVADRQNDFRSDDTLPASFKHVSSGYNAATYGFDRGHMCPSADRTSSIEDNSATFLMTNMIPQASGNNQGPWNNMEGYIRTQLNGTQNELYIVSGGTGVGGNSTTGHWDSIVDTAGNTVTVPQYTWKVIMVLPNAAGNDVARVNTSTRTFAVIMPNNDNIRPDDWKKYLATVDQVEALSGYDFFSNVPVAIQNVIEAQLDAVNDTAPVANGQSTTTAEDTQKQITLTASDFNVNNVQTYTVVNGPSHGTLTGGTGGTFTYTPAQDYFGSDSFTFKANDGALDSNVATVNITVSEVNDTPVANADSKTTNQDTPLTFPASDLTANDTTGAANESGQTLTVTSVTPAANTHGTASLSSGQITYTPDAGFHGSASFDYQVCDNGTTNGAADSKCATGTVNLTVNAVGKTTPVITWANPADIIYGTPLGGAQLNATADVPGTFTYTPAAGTVQGKGAHTLHVDFVPTDTTNYNNASKDVSINVLSAVLNISMTADRNPAIVGLNFNYKPVITNTGDAPATNVTLTDVLPAQVTFSAVSASQGSCGYDSVTRAVTCNVGTIAAGSSVNVQITVKPRDEGTLNNTASITASQWDPATGNSSASVNGLPAIKQVDLAVTMVESADPIFAGENETYTIKVKNINTTFDATGVALTDSLPASLNFVSATTSQGSLVTPPVGSTGIVTANLGTIAPNQTATVTITVKSTAAGLVTNSATATSTESDSNPANNTASQVITVKDADLQKVLLTKQVLTGGCENTTGQVYLTGPAGPGGLTISLSSNVSGASVPASVFIPEGQMVSPAFNVTTSPVGAKQVGLITATLGAQNVSRGITINKGNGTCQ